MTERPMRTVPDQGIVLTCEGPKRHQQTIYLPDASREAAVQLGSFLDGTSGWYVVRPREREIPETLARCQIPGCGAWIQAEVFGYE